MAGLVSHPPRQTPRYPNTHTDTHTQHAHASWLRRCITGRTQGPLAYYRGPTAPVDATVSSSSTWTHKPKSIMRYT